MLSGLRFGSKKAGSGSKDSKNDATASSTTTAPKQSAPAPQPATRDDWMVNEDYYDPMDDARRQAAAEAEAARRARSKQPHQVMLGSTNLPGAPTEGGLWRPPNRQADSPADTDVPTPAPAPVAKPVVGDGGLGWRNRIAVSGRREEVDGVYVGVLEKQRRRAEGDRGKGAQEGKPREHAVRGPSDRERGRDREYRSRDDRDDRGRRDDRRRDDGRRDGKDSRAPPPVLNAPSADWMAQQRARKAEEAARAQARATRDAEILAQRAQNPAPAETSASADAAAPTALTEATEAPADADRPRIRLEDVDAARDDLSMLSDGQLVKLSHMLRGQGKDTARVKAALDAKRRAERERVGTFGDALSVREESAAERAIREARDGVALRDDVAGPAGGPPGDPDSIRALRVGERSSRCDEVAAMRAIAKNKHYRLDDLDTQFDSIKAADSSIAAVAPLRPARDPSDRCRYCLKGLVVDRVVWMGRHVYVYVPAHALAAGHVVIGTREHVGAQVELDAAEWVEMERAKRMLSLLFRDRNQAVVFLEVCVRGDMRAGGSRASGTSGFDTGRYSGAGGGHCVVHCVPMAPQVYMELPYRVRKELLDAEEGGNKAIINLATRGLRASLPSDTVFSYVAIEFGLDIAPQDPAAAGTHGRFGFICSSTSRAADPARSANTGARGPVLGGYGDAAYFAAEGHDVMVSHFRERVAYDSTPAQAPAAAQAAAVPKKTAVSSVGGGSYELLDDDFAAAMASEEAELEAKPAKPAPPPPGPAQPDRFAPGYARIVDSKDFPLDLLLSTVASAMGVDPLELRRRKDKKELSGMAHAVRRWGEKYKDMIEEKR